VLNRQTIEDIMYGRKSSAGIGALLFFLSLLYGAAMEIRSRCYALGLIRRRRLPIKVISVGNITVGGTGKTPAVLLIAGMLRRHGRRPVILSRGYGSGNEATVRLISGSSGDAASAGDEPALMARRLPDVPVVVGRDRYQGGMLAHERTGADTAILDDGFQHLPVLRDLDIVLIDAANPFGKGMLLPAGILREPLRALQRADIVIFTRSDRSTDLDALRSDVRRYTAARFFTARHAPVELVDVATGSTRTLESLRGTPVTAFAGIARPDAFVALVGSLGAAIKGSFIFPDHHSYTKADLEMLHRNAADNGSALLVTTEKDGVKIRTAAPAEIWALRIEMEVLEKDAWEDVLLDRL
jgi:tetraacyldisaccharide 4'-kinase